MKKVTPKEFTGWNISIMQLFGSGPKMTIVYGNCELTFSSRILMIDNPPVECPYCHAINILPVKVDFINKNSM